MKEGPKGILFTQQEKLLLLTTLRDKSDGVRESITQGRRMLDVRTLETSERMTVAKNLENLEDYLKVVEGALGKVMRTPALG